MQSIETKYLPCTNTRGSRIKAECVAGNITIPYPHAENIDGAHILAAKELCRKLAERNVKEYGGKLEDEPWLRPFVTGTIKNGNFVHVFIS
jgi:hypothetical protein